MAVYGVQLRNPQGKVVFDASDTTWNYLGYFTAPANGFASLVIPAAALMDTVQIQVSYLNAPLATQKTFVHTVSYDKATGKFTATGGTVNTAVLVVGR